MTLQAKGVVYQRLRLGELAERHMAWLAQSDAVVYVVALRGIFSKRVNVVRLQSSLGVVPALLARVAVALFNGSAPLDMSAGVPLRRGPALPGRVLGTSFSGGDIAPGLRASVTVESYQPLFQLGRHFAPSQRGRAFQFGLSALLAALALSAPFGSRSFGRDAAGVGLTKSLPVGFGYSIQPRAVAANEFKWGAFHGVVSGAVAHSDGRALAAPAETQAGWVWAWTVTKLANLVVASDEPPRSLTVFVAPGQGWEFVSASTFAQAHTPLFYAENS